MQTFKIGQRVKPSGYFDSSEGRLPSGIGRVVRYDSSNGQYAVVWAGREILVWPEEIVAVNSNPLRSI